MVTEALESKDVTEADPDMDEQVAEGRLIRLLKQESIQAHECFGMGDIWGSGPPGLIMSQF